MHVTSQHATLHHCMLRHATPRHSTSQHDIFKQHGTNMTSIFDRKPETERLIAFLSAETEIRPIKYGELVKVVANGKCRTINDIRGFLSSARRIMRDKHLSKFGTIRGEGIQRMTADEVALYGNKRRKRATKQLKEGRKDNSTIIGNNDLSVNARATVSVNEIIFVKAIYDLEGAKEMIKVATVNGHEAMANIYAAAR